MGPFLSFGFCSASVRDAERLGGCGTGVFKCANVDGEGGKGSGGIIEDDVETLLETIISYIFTYIQSDTHTHTHKQRCMCTFHGFIRV